MSQNPYAPPSAVPGPNDPRSAPAGQIDIGDAMAEAWQAMIENWAVAMVGYLLYFVLAVVSVMTCLGTFLLTPVLYWGYTALYLNIFDGDAEVGDLFAGFNRFGDALGSILVYSIAMGVLFVPAFVPYGVAAAMEQPILANMALIVMLAILGFVFCRLALAPFYIVDQEMGAIEAMRTAWQVTEDQKVTMVLVLLLTALVSWVGSLVVFIGTLFTTPLATLIWVAAYRHLEPLEQETGPFQGPPPTYDAPPARYAADPHAAGRPPY